MALSSGEAKLLRDSWVGLSGDLQKHGREIFVRLFEKYPEVKGDFAIAGISGMNSAQLRSSPEGGAHGAFVFGGIGGFVACCDNAAAFKECCAKNVRTHLPRRVNIEKYKKVFDVTKGYLKEAGISGPTLDAWVKFCDVCASGLDAQLHAQG